MPADARRWPALPAYASWKESRDALHLCCQVVGKYRLGRTPWVPHSWHATLYPVPRGLTTGPMPDADGTVEVLFDLLAHRLVVTASDGKAGGFALGPTSLRAFGDQFRDVVAFVGGTPTWHGAPNEVEEPVPFAEDEAERPWDAGAIGLFHQALLATARVFDAHRTGFLGKASPAHLFWGSFDLAVTRFSGRRAPPHPGGVPNLPDEVTREAYSHEVQSSGFWPGGGPSEDAAFYAYAYPKPDGFEAALEDVPGVSWSEDAGEYVLPYEVVGRADDPDVALTRFLDAAYVAAASLGAWDREALECPRGRPLVVRPVTAG